jgi:hypothetical protein
MQGCAGSKHWRLAAGNGVLAVSTGGWQQATVCWQYALELADRKGADFETEKETGIRIILKASYSTED